MSDKRWYYTDGSHWFYHDGDAWKVYGFDKKFGRDGSNGDVSHEYKNAVIALAQTMMLMTASCILPS